MSRRIQRRRAYETITICALHQEKGYEIASLCALAGIPRGSYYKWLNRETCASEKENALLLEELIRLYSEVNGIYGYRRMTMNVNSRLKRNYNRKRIYRLMKSVHMQAVIRRKKKHYIRSIPLFVLSPRNPLALGLRGDPCFPHSTRDRSRYMV